MTITSKTTKQELKDFISLNISKVKEVSKELYDQLLYTDRMLRKDETKVTKKDLIDLAKETMQVVSDFKVPEYMQVVAENSVKKTLRKSKATEKVEESEDEKENEVVPEKEENAKVEKSAKKTTAKKEKKADKESGVTVLGNGKNEKEVSLVESFKETFELDDNTYTIAHDITTMEDLYKAMENEETIVFAMYWSKRHLKQFDYFNGQLDAPEEFPLDLDLCTCIYVSEEFKVCYSVSMYTEANYTILPQDIEEVDGIRYNGGIEYQIYRQS